MITVTIESLKGGRMFQAAQKPLPIVRPGPDRLRGKRVNHPSVTAYRIDTMLIPVLNSDARVLGFIAHEHLRDFQPVRFDGTVLIDVERDQVFDGVQMIEGE